MLKAAFALIGIGAYLGLLVEVDITHLALALMAVFVVFNVLGARESSRLQGIFRRSWYRNQLSYDLATRLLEDAPPGTVIVGELATMASTGPVSSRVASIPAVTKRSWRSAKAFTRRGPTSGRSGSNTLNDPGLQRVF